MEDEKKIVNLSKDTTFQMRMNSTVKDRLEEIYGRCGMTLTDAVNCFFQQSINLGGMPLVLGEDDVARRRLQAYYNRINEMVEKDDTV